MPAAPQQQQSGSDSGLGPVWIVALVFLGFYAIWYGASGYIVKFVFSLNLFQAHLVQFFLGQTALAHEIYLMQTINPNSVSWDQLIQLTHQVGSYTKYPVIAALLLCAFLLYFSNTTLKFRRRHDMKSLRAQEQFNWPAIMPVMQLNLVDTDINEGPWSMAQSPIEFARKYDLLRKDDALLDKPMPGMEMTAAIRRSDAKRVFTLQLGPYWEGFERCPAYVRALAAVFLARVNRDRDAARMILDTLDRTCSDGKPNFSVAYPTLKKYQHDERLQEIIGLHAYRLTVMASLLYISREDGVVPSSEFLWLKPIDRRLWYMLNCVGRQTPFAEVAGPFAHWLAEKAMGRRSLVPMIDEAINALEMAVKDVKLSAKEVRELKS